ncbi:hypothetical protein SNE40_009090 [Patella caerulea]|uniref:HPS5-like beta-propeller domain-containing protein n=2 Tax=Patella caerulea TaxID=87958 RepID=A0AAN8JNI9_PATCE
MDEKVEPNVPPLTTVSRAPSSSPSPANLTKDVSKSTAITKSIPQEHEQLWALMSQIPRKAQRGLLMQCELVLTCVDVSDQYIVLGTNIGLVFLYNRDKTSMERLRTESSNDVVMCVKLHHGLDYQLAVGTTSGTIRIFLLPSSSIALGQNKTLQKLDIKDLHRTCVTSIEWSTNGMKLFSGDKNGRVVVTVVDFYEGQSTSKVLLDEDIADAEIIQMSYDHKALLVTTKYRTIVCRTDEDSRVIQIGHQERKVGVFGACFIPGMCKPSDAKLFATRPGCRLWRASINGTVENTFIFKEVLSDAIPVIPLIKPEIVTPQKEEPQFGRLYIYREDELVTWHGGNLFIIEATNSQVLCVQSRIGTIVDLAINNDEIFILRKNTEINLVRIALKPEEVKHQVKIGVQPKFDSSPVEENKTTSNLTRINEELKNKGQSAKGFFQKNVIGKLKNLDFKPGTRNISNETSVRSLIDGNEIYVTPDSSPDLPPVIKLKTPELTGLEVFEGVSPSSSNSPSPEKQVSGGTLYQQAPVATTSIYYNKDDSPTSVHTSSTHSAISQQMMSSTTSTTSSNTQKDGGASGDIVFSQKVKKPKRRKNKTEKLKDKETDDIDDDDTISVPVSPVKTAKQLDKLEEFENKSVIPPGEFADDQVGNLDALSRADDILKRSLAVLNVQEPASPPPTVVQKSPEKGKEEDAASLDYRQALKLKSWDKTKMGEDENNKIEIREVKKDVEKSEDGDKDSNAKTSLQSSNQKTKHAKQESSAISVNKSPKEKSLPNSLTDRDFPRTLSLEDSCEPFSEASVDDFYSIYANRRSDSSSSSLTSPVGNVRLKSPETEAYLSRPSGSKPTPQRLESVDGKINITANVFEEITTGANTYSLSLSETHVWFTDKSENIYYSSLSGPKVIWRKAAGSGTQIAVSQNGHIVWRLHRNVAYAGTKITSKRPEGLKWVDAVKEVAYIAVDDSSAWYIKTDGKVMMQKGLSKDRPCFKSYPAQCSYELKQIACCNGVVWAITTDMKLLYRKGITENCEVGESWETINSGTESLFFGHVYLEHTNGWAIDVLGRIWCLTDVSMEKPTGSGKWWQVPLSEYFVEDSTALDHLKSLASKFDPQKLTYLISSNRGGLIAASKTSIWVCPEYKNILHVCRGSILGFRWDDCPPVGIAASTVWKLVCADLCDLDWGLVWAQQPNGDIYTFPADTRVPSTVPSSPAFTCLSACRLAVWGLTDDGRVYARSGMGPYCPQGSKWSQLDLSQLGDAHLVHLCCNMQYIWAVDSAGMVYQRIGCKSPADQELSPVWLPLDSFSGIAFNHIAVGSQYWMVWAVDSRKLAYVRIGITEKLPIGKEWKNAPGIQVIKLSISETGVWALNPQGEVFYRYGITDKNVQGDYWKKIPGLSTCISVSSSDELWSVGTQGQLMHLKFRYLQRREMVEEVGTLRSLSIGSDEGEWELV